MPIVLSNTVLTGSKQGCSSEALGGFWRSAFFFGSLEGCGWSDGIEYYLLLETLVRR